MAYQRITREQKDRLLALAEADDNLLHSRNMKQKAEAWNELAMELNLMRGAQRDGPGWQKCYRDLINNAVGRICASKNQNDTQAQYGDGGPSYGGRGETSQNSLLIQYYDVPDPAVVIKEEDNKDTYTAPPFHLRRKRRRPPNHEANKQMLVTCLRTRPHLVHSSKHLREWEEVAQEMEAAGCDACRTGKQWKLYWRDCKSAIKRKIMQKKLEESKGSSGTVFSEVEEDILRLMVSKEAREHENELGYGSDPPDGINDGIVSDDEDEMTKGNGRVKDPLKSSTALIVQELQRLTKQVGRRTVGGRMEEGEVARELKRVRVAMTTQHNAMMQEMKNLTNAVMSVTDALDRAARALQPPP